MFCPISPGQARVTSLHIIMTYVNDERRHYAPSLHHTPPHSTTLHHKNPDRSAPILLLAIITNLEIDWLNYKTSRNKVNIQLRNAKKDYYSTKISGQKCNPKEAWKTINNILGRQSKPTVVNELKLGEKRLTNTKDIAEGFNDYFSNIGPDLASKIDTPNLNFQTHVEKAKSEFSAFQPVTVSNVYHLLHVFLATKPLVLIRYLVKLLK